MLTIKIKAPTEGWNDEVAPEEFWGDVVQPEASIEAPAEAWTDTSNKSSNGLFTEGSVKRQTTAAECHETPKVPFCKPGTKLLPNHPWVDKLIFTGEMLDIWPMTKPKPLEDAPCKFILFERDLKLAVSYLKTAKQIGVSLVLDHLSYQGRVCYISLSTEDTDYIVDVITLSTHVKLLAPIFGDKGIVKVMYGSEEGSLYWLQQKLELFVANLFELQRGMNRLEKQKSRTLREILTADFEVSFSTFENYDFRLRPLTQSAADYIRAHSHFLIYLYKKIRNDIIRFYGKKSYIKIANKINVLCFEERSHPNVLNDQYAIDDIRRIQAGQQRMMKQLLAWRDKVACKHNIDVEEVMKYECLYALVVVMPDNEFIMVMCDGSQYVKKDIEELSSYISSNRCNLEGYNEVATEVANQMTYKEARTIWTQMHVGSAAPFGFMQPFLGTEGLTKNQKKRRKEIQRQLTSETPPNTIQKVLSAQGINLKEGLTQKQRKRYEAIQNQQASEAALKTKQMVLSAQGMEGLTKKQKRRLNAAQQQQASGAPLKSMQTVLSAQEDEVHMNQASEALSTSMQIVLSAQEKKGLTRKQRDHYDAFQMLARKGHLGPHIQLEGRDPMDRRSPSNLRGNVDSSSYSAEGTKGGFATYRSDSPARSPEPEVGGERWVNTLTSKRLSGDQYSFSRNDRDDDSENVSHRGFRPRDKINSQSSRTSRRYEDDDERDGERGLRFESPPSKGPFQDDSRIDSSRFSSSSRGEPRIVQFESGQSPYLYEEQSSRDYRGESLQNDSAPSKPALQHSSRHAVQFSQPKENLVFEPPHRKGSPAFDSERGGPSMSFERAPLNYSPPYGGPSTVDEGIGRVSYPGGARRDPSPVSRQTHPGRPSQMFSREETPPQTYPIRPREDPSSAYPIRSREDSPPKIYPTRPRRDPSPTYPIRSREESPPHTYPIRPREDPLATYPIRAREDSPPKIDPIRPRKGPSPTCPVRSREGSPPQTYPIRPREDPSSTYPMRSREDSPPQSYPIRPRRDPSPMYPVRSRESSPPQTYPIRPREDPSSTYPMRSREDSPPKTYPIRPRRDPSPTYPIRSREGSPAQTYPIRPRRDPSPTYLIRSREGSPAQTYPIRPTRDPSPMYPIRSREGSSPETYPIRPREVPSATYPMRSRQDSPPKTFPIRPRKDPSPTYPVRSGESSPPQTYSIRPRKDHSSMYSINSREDSPPQPYPIRLREDPSSTYPIRSRENSPPETYPFRPTEDPSSMYPVSSREDSPPQSYPIRSRKDPTQTYPFRAREDSPPQSYPVRRGEDPSPEYPIRSGKTPRLELTTSAGGRVSHKCPPGDLGKILRRRPLRLTQ